MEPISLHVVGHYRQRNVPVPVRFNMMLPSVCLRPINRLYTEKREAEVDVRVWLFFFVTQCDGFGSVSNVALIVMSASLRSRTWSSIFRQTRYECTVPR